MPLSPRRPSRRGVCALALCTLLAGGCASGPPAAPEGAPGATSPPAAPAKPAAPPPANVNLQGFPPEYRQGYADGCVSAKGIPYKDEARYKGDTQYRSGWQDGNALCRR